MGSPCNVLSLALPELTVSVIVELGWRRLSSWFTPSCLHIPIYVITLLPACIGCDVPVKWQSSALVVIVVCGSGMVQLVWHNWLYGFYGLHR
jgi:hypothetical protein